jgi:hypothetical protein
MTIDSMVNELRRQVLFVHRLYSAEAHRLVFQTKIRRRSFVWSTEFPVLDTKIG